MTYQDPYGDKKFINAEALLKFNGVDQYFLAGSVPSTYTVTFVSDESGYLAHYAFTSSKSYKNAVEDPVKLLHDAVSLNGTTIEVGRKGANYFDGVVGFVRVFDKELSLNEIQLITLETNLFNLPPSLHANCVAEYIAPRFAYKDTGNIYGKGANANILFDSSKQYGAVTADHSELINFDNVNRPRGDKIAHGEGNNAYTYTGVTKVGDLAVFAPLDADDIIILDTTDNSLTKIAHGEGNSAYTGVTSINDLAIFQAWQADDIIILDTTDNSLTKITHGEGGSAFFGITTVGDLVIFAPYRANNIVILDTTDNSLTKIAHGEGNNAFNGVTTVGDLAVFAPLDANDIVILDTTDNSLTKIAHGEVGNAYTGVTTIGDLVVFSPRNANNIIILDTTDNSTTKIAHNEGVNAAFGGVTTVGDLAVFAPRDADNIMILDTNTNALTKIAHGEGNDAFRGVKSTGNLAVFQAWNANNIIILDTTDNSITKIAHNEGGNAFNDITIVDDLAVFAPRNADNIVTITTEVYSSSYAIKDFYQTSENLKWREDLEDIEVASGLQPINNGLEVANLDTVVINSYTNTSPYIGWVENETFYLSNTYTGSDFDVSLSGGDITIEFKKNMTIWGIFDGEELRDKDIVEILNNGFPRQTDKADIVNINFNQELSSGTLEEHNGKTVTHTVTSPTFTDVNELR